MLDWFNSIIYMYCIWDSLDLHLMLKQTSENEQGTAEVGFGLRKYDLKPPVYCMKAHIIMKVHSSLAKWKEIHSRPQ